MYGIFTIAVHYIISLNWSHTSTPGKTPEEFTGAVRLRLCWTSPTGLTWKSTGTPCHLTIKPGIKGKTKSYKSCTEWPPRCKLQALNQGGLLWCCRSNTVVPLGKNCVTITPQAGIREHVMGLWPQKILVSMKNTDTKNCYEASHRNVKFCELSVSICERRKGGGGIKDIQKPGKVGKDLKQK